MDKETQKKLTKPFSKDEVKPAPKGKFGSYVPHHLVTKRLNEHAYGQWSHTLKEVVRDSSGSVRAVITTFTLFGVSHDEVGDVDNNDVKNNNTEGELLKLCMSDALKRGAMRHGIGLHLWTGEVTEEEHYANKSAAPQSKPKVQVEKAPSKPMTKEEAVGLNKAAEDFAKDIGAAPTQVADQINNILEGMIPNEVKRAEIKKKVYAELTNNGLEKDLEKWTNKDCDLFITTVEQELDLVDTVSQVFDTNTVKVCPQCNTAGNIEDNRQKKEEDPGKFGKIPDFACSNYGDNNGCGKGWWIGNEELPSEWI